MSMTAHDTLSFFTPDEFLCFEYRLPSKTYNLAHVLLNRSEADHVFIPIRCLQYLVIVEQNAFWFIDSLAYAVRDNEGGRLVRISWHPVIAPSERKALDQHMDCRVNFYGDDMKEIQTRLNGEFYKGMLQIDQRYRDTLQTTSPPNILSLTPVA